VDNGDTRKTESPNAEFTVGVRMRQKWFLEVEFTARAVTALFDIPAWTWLGDGFMIDSVQVNY